jgi:hypothetical protein
MRNGMANSMEPEAIQYWCAVKHEQIGDEILKPSVVNVILKLILIVVVQIL